ncbi:MAG: DUF2282 domain-containing protein [Massilia sp.]
MNNRHALLAAALATICASAAAADPAPVAPAEQEQCYGIAKAGQNDCSTPKHSCAGLAKADKDPSEWKMVVKGSCVKAGGKLTADK